MGYQGGWDFLQTVFLMKQNAIRDCDPFEP